MRKNLINNITEMNISKDAKSEKKKINPNLPTGFILLVFVLFDHFYVISVNGFEVVSHGNDCIAVFFP